MSLFVIFKFPTVPSPYVLMLAGEPRRQMSASTGGHCRGHCRRDIAGAQDKVSDQGIPEKRHMVSASVAQGYHLWY
ncbi:unnamed protein product [Staurois parvus]|uniref:Uncharacterized protein n=1 Tax=Staurois parvus TaxID=386267 RepID=A0ABN9EAK4_9NEOB|nr:unnamed protein product [Staurois parvus]